MLTKVLSIILRWKNQKFPPELFGWRCIITQPKRAGSSLTNDNSGKDLCDCIMVQKPVAILVGNQIQLQNEQQQARSIWLEDKFHGFNASVFDYIDIILQGKSFILSVGGIYEINPLYISVNEKCPEPNSQDWKLWISQLSSIVPNANKESGKQSPGLWLTFINPLPLKVRKLIPSNFLISSFGDLITIESIIKEKAVK